MATINNSSWPRWPESKWSRLDRIPIRRCSSSSASWRPASAGLGRRWSRGAGRPSSWTDRSADTRRTCRWSAGWPGPCAAPASSWPAAAPSTSASATPTGTPGWRPRRRPESWPECTADSRAPSGSDLRRLNGSVRRRNQWTPSSLGVADAGRQDLLLLRTRNWQWICCSGCDSNEQADFHQGISRIWPVWPGVAIRSYREQAVSLRPWRFYDHAISIGFTSYRLPISNTPTQYTNIHVCEPKIEMIIKCVMNDEFPGDRTLFNTTP